MEQGQVEETDGKAVDPDDDLYRSMNLLYNVCVEHGIHKRVLGSIMDTEQIDPEVLTALQRFIDEYDNWLD